MSSLPQRIWRYIWGPNVHRCYNVRTNETNALQECKYTPNEIENTSKTLLGISSFTKSVLTYSMPFWIVLIYRKGYYTVSHALGFAKFTGLWCLLYFAIILVRGFGRYRNPEYVQFMKVLNDCLSNVADQEKKKQLRNYDFDFTYWPVDFCWNEVNNNRTQRRRISTWSRLTSSFRNPLSLIFVGIPMEFASYLISRLFGISIMYPGSTAMMRAAIGPALVDGRSKLVQQYRGRRAKLEAEDGNLIDTMFVDRRSSSHPRRLEQGNAPDVASELGNTLVVCCEGNAGFYEVGCMGTSLEKGYSVLGWNHPGFMWSTGSPYPEADKSAIDIVMQYAIHRLGFQPPNIIIFAWSIGAFSGINAAASYPDIKGLFLDATFNDVLVFAKKIMPEFAEPLVQYTVRNHLNLNNAENLRRFKGPVSFVRRDHDEVMNIEGQRFTHSNLGNVLLEDFLSYRFPNLFESKFDGSNRQAELLRRWLDAPGEDERGAIMSDLGVSYAECRRLILDALSSGETDYPMSVGDQLSSDEKSKVILFLASRYMIHHASTHCPQLPSRKFALPWDPSHLREGESRNDHDFELIN